MNTEQVQEKQSVKLWNPQELNQFNKDLCQWTMDLMEQVLPKEHQANLEVLVLRRLYAKAGLLNMNDLVGCTYTQAIWGLDKQANIAHSWAVVMSMDYSTILRPFGLKPGVQKPDFVLKKEHSFDGVLLYGYDDALRNLEVMMSLDPLKAHWFYIYNVITGEEKRPKFPDTLPPITEPIPKELTLRDVI